jgi:CheY-like chemotaxis protein
MIRILLVEDDPLIYRLYEKAFSLAGYQVDVTDNGQSGLDKLQKATPDIILLDIMMPGMNGVELLSKIKDEPKTKDIPVVVLTNISDMRVAHEVAEHGASMTLIKSELDPDQVINWVNSVLAKAGKDLSGIKAPATPAALASTAPSNPEPAAASDIPAESDLGEPEELSASGSDGNQTTKA